MSDNDEHAKFKDKDVKVSRTYKDSVFRDLFTSWESPISLYNALFSSNVPLDAKVEHLQISNAMYQAFRCDLSFIVGDDLVVIVEHQSTINLNMPIRLLLYIAKLYENILDEHLRYNRSLKKIPTPRFAVLYNGKESFPERTELKLSDAYILKDVGIQLELRVPVFNINYGYNKEMMEQCSSLKGYSYMEAGVRKYEEYGDDKFAMAVEDCIKEGLLVDYLKKQIKRVRNMLQGEYSFEKELEVRGLEEREKGILIGLERGREEGIEARTLALARSFRDMGVSLDKVAKATGLREEEIKAL